MGFNMNKLTRVGQVLKKFESEEPQYVALDTRGDCPSKVLIEGNHYRIRSESDTVTGNMIFEFDGIYQGISHKNEINSALEDASSLSKIFQEDLIGYEDKLHDFMENVDEKVYLTFLEESTKCVVIIDPTDNVVFLVKVSN